MDERELQEVLDSGAIGHLSFPDYYSRLRGSDEYSSLASTLFGLGVVGARWETISTTPVQGLYHACLVLTLADFSTPEPLRWMGPSVFIVPGSQIHLRYITAGACNCFFYSLEGQDLRVEYIIASEQAINEINAVLKTGRIGKMPIRLWLRTHHFRTTTKGLARGLGFSGISKVRWEANTDELRSSDSWDAYLVATLARTSLTMQPVLTPEWFVETMVQGLRYADGYQIRVNADAAELWLLFRQLLPLNARYKRLLKRHGVSYRRRTKKDWLDAPLHYSTLSWTQLSEEDRRSRREAQRRSRTPE